jgi:hypothetical protein
MLCLTQGGSRAYLEEFDSFNFAMYVNKLHCRAPLFSPALSNFPLLRNFKLRELESIPVYAILPRVGQNIASCIITKCMSQSQNSSQPRLTRQGLSVYCTIVSSGVFHIWRQVSPGVRASNKAMGLAPAYYSWGRPLRLGRSVQFSCYRKMKFDNWQEIIPKVVSLQNQTSSGTLASLSCLRSVNLLFVLIFLRHY